MVQADRMRRARPALARCRAAGRTLRRAGLLTGLAAAGWLLGGAAAAADDLPGAGLEPAAAVASEAGDITGAAPQESGHAVEHTADDAPEDVADRVAAEQGGAAGTGVPALDSVTESGGVTEAAGAAGAGARDVVETTAQGTGEVVAGTVDAGRKVGGFAEDSLGEGSLTESELAGAVSDGIVSETGRIQGGLEQTIQEGPRTGIEGIGGLDGVYAAPVAHDSADERREGPGRRDSDAAAADESDAEDAASAARPAQHARTGAVPAAAAAEAENTGGEQSADTADSGTPLTGSAWHEASDSTGTVSPSPVPAAPAGFLMSRGHTLRLVAQRVALPADPAVVVRYTADDPSFSPD
ncbi:hypothetical protein [Streptomonospora wellingtoniae]|uniref:Uncharacterized protein n=1 Tax=Streptomonospora wellingtoniae TaxID=3075544 RepID=A0ABU2KMV7_9ACTN|nr:hypothetical protein [Streptomonospora sp. DSM 45055]MDT0300599.1 hypothetical protein [Streptomonospora sp. DSM 45055]